MKRYGVRPSVRPIRLLQQRVAGELMWAWRVGDIDRLLHGWRCSSTRPQQQMQVVPRCQLTYEAEPVLLLLVLKYFFFSMIVYVVTSSQHSAHRAYVVII